jgi:3-deoxy-7-phosphoheptulonate synthase
MSNLRAPEKADSALPIMAESVRARDILLATHIQTELDVVRLYQNAEATTRARLGYDEPDVIDVSDLVDVRATKQPMIPPRLLVAALPMSARAAETTRRARNEVADIYALREDKLVAALGECAVYNPDATIEYTGHVQRFQEMFPHLKLLQRTFYEKPRTFKERGANAAWKGFLYDPLLDGSDDINLGAIAVRMLACQIADLGVPTIKEQLNAQTPQITDGLITQDNIGARNAYDQKAMEFSSATSAIAGHKNSLEGDIAIAVAAAATAHSPHTFLGTDYDGQLSLVKGSGNETAHLILRGGKQGPNYSAESVEEAKEILERHGLMASLGIDASHDNSRKKADNQPAVVEDISQQIEEGEQSIRAVHMETALVAGNQKHRRGQSLDELTYGQSITDECAGLGATEGMLSRLNEAAAKRSERSLRPMSSARTN